MAALEVCQSDLPLRKTCISAAWRAVKWVSSCITSGSEAASELRPHVPGSSQVMTSTAVHQGLAISAHNGAPLQAAFPEHPQGQLWLLRAMLKCEALPPLPLPSPALTFHRYQTYNPLPSFFTSIISINLLHFQFQLNVCLLEEPTTTFFH